MGKSHTVSVQSHSNQDWKPGGDPDRESRKGITDVKWEA